MRVEQRARSKGIWRKKADQKSKNRPRKRLRRRRNRSRSKSRAWCPTSQSNLWFRRERSELTRSQYEDFIQLICPKFKYNTDNYNFIVNLNTEIFSRFRLKAVVSLIQFSRFDKIVAMADDLLDLEYKLLDQENLVNLFEFQKSKWDFLELEEILQGNKRQCCYAIPNIIYKASAMSNLVQTPEVG